MYEFWLIAIRPISRISASSFRTSRTSSLCSSFWTLSRQHVTRRCNASAAVTSGSMIIRLCREQVSAERRSRDGRRDRMHIGQKYSCCRSSSASSSAKSGAAGSTYFTQSATAVAAYGQNFSSTSNSTITSITSTWQAFLGQMFLLVPAHPGSPRQRVIKWSCVCVLLLVTKQHTTTTNV